MTKDSYLDPYRQSAQTHGSDFEVTLWVNAKSQQRRFEVFTRMFPLNDKIILDAGCSRGDFAQYLIDKNIHYKRFIGIDGLDEVIRFANSRNLPEAEFHAGDFLANPQLLQLGHPQVICISGTLNTMTLRQAVKVLESAWLAASDALLFNFLSDRSQRIGKEVSGPAKRLNTIKLLDWALSKTDAVAFRQDYFNQGHDATIMMRKYANT